MKNLHQEIGYDLAAPLLRDSWNFAPDLAEYADLLGDVGMAIVREHISTVYAENPDDFRAQHLMETVLATEGDVDELIAFLVSHLDNHGWQHLRITRELDAAGRPDEALAWAEQRADVVRRLRGLATRRWEPWKSSGSTWRCCA